MHRDHILTKVRGQVLIIAIIFLAVILILSATMFSKVSSFLRFGSISAQSSQATEMAEAGAERALWQLNQTAGAYTGETNTALGTTGTFTVTITNKSPSLKTITATGYIPNATSAKSKRTIKVDAAIDSQTISFHYAAQVGTGGLIMKNSSTINGSVYSNGNVTGSGSSVITGDAYAVTSISSPDPWVQGTKHPNSPPVDMPVADPPTFYQSWKTQAEAGGVTNCPGGTCSFNSGSPNIGPQKYVGDVFFQNTAQAIMNGPIWVTGNVIIQNTASIKLNDSFGSMGSVLISDGTITTQNSGAFIPTSANPKGYVLVVSTLTTNNAISIQNSGVNAVFYALDGGADLQNTAQVTSLVAKTLELENSASLTYDSGLASAQFTSGPGASWLIKKGTYKQTVSP